MWLGVKTMTACACLTPSLSRPTASLFTHRSICAADRLLDGSPASIHSGFSETGLSLGKRKERMLHFGMSRSGHFDLIGIVAVRWGFSPISKEDLNDIKRSGESWVWGKLHVTSKCAPF